MMYSNYAINISVIIGSIMAASTKTLQFISVPVLKFIFKRYTGKASLWTQGLGAQTLHTWTHGPLDSWALENWALGLLKLGIWTLGVRTTGRLDLERLEADRLEVRGLDAWVLDACTFGLWTPGRLDFGRLNKLRFNNYAFATKEIL